MKLTPLILTLGLGLLPALAQDATPAPAPAAAPRLARFAAHLQLTDAQKASIQSIHSKHQEALGAKRKAVKESRTALMAAMAKPEARVEDLKALNRAHADLAFDLRLEERAMHQEVRALLTPEQREQSARMEGRMQGMHMGHRGHHGDFDHAGPIQPGSPSR